MAKLSFAAAVKEWADATEEKLTKVFREASSEVIDTAAENAPVITGFLQNSVEVVLNGEIPPATRSNPGGTFARDTSYQAIIAGANLGDTIAAGWTASYSIHVEYGTSKMAPRQFVGRAVQQWQAIVDRAVARHRG